MGQSKNGAEEDGQVQRGSLSDGLVEVLESAAKLQSIVPDAVLVGGSVSAAYAGHRLSFDHDHVLALMERYEAVLEAVEAADGWATSVRNSKPPMTIMGSLDGIEAGLRQLRRTIPLETQLLDLPSGHQVRIPTIEEALRVKSYLVIQRNQVRDYLDVAALADRMGVARAAEVLSDIDDYYLDRSDTAESVGTELIVKLSHPDPKDERVTKALATYKGLDLRWHRWADVVSACQDLAQAILERSE